MINFGLLGLEAQQVILLRSFQIANDLASAGFEMQRMITEKMFASNEASFTVMRGGSADSVVQGYRRKVRANARRLRARRP